MRPHTVTAPAYVNRYMNMCIWVWRPPGPGARDAKVGAPPAVSAGRRACGEKVTVWSSK